MGSNVPPIMPNFTLFRLSPLVFISLYDTRNQAGGLIIAAPLVISASGNSLVRARITSEIVYEGALIGLQNSIRTLVWIGLAVSTRTCGSGSALTSAASNPAITVLTLVFNSSKTTVSVAILSWIALRR